MWTRYIFQYLSRMRMRIILICFCFILNLGWSDFIIGLGGCATYPYRDNCINTSISAHVCLCSCHRSRESISWKLLLTVYLLASLDRLVCLSHRWQVNPIVETYNYSTVWLYHTAAPLEWKWISPRWLWVGLLNLWFNLISSMLFCARGISLELSHNSWFHLAYRCGKVQHLSVGIHF